jgi:N6-adenosine-specific RNA methylase IME4
LPDASRTKVLAKLGDLPDMRAARNALRREERVEKLAEISKENSPLTGKLGRFPVLYADPPWRYEHVKTNSRSIENQYPTMELSEICGLKVASIATPDAILFLWATSPKLAEAMKVLEAWGFTYRTCMVWVKNKVGMGYYARQQHELLLIATIGSPPVPPESARPSSVVTRPRGEHSAKPPVFYEIIERMYPELKRIELFCRAPREGWTAWGNQS